MKQKQANAISYTHYVSSLACVSRSCQHFQESRETNPPAFQEFFDQRFRYHGTIPLTKEPEVSENHTLPYTSLWSHLWINPSPAQETASLIYCWLRNPYQTQTNKQSLKDDDIDADACVLRTASAQKWHKNPLQKRGGIFQISLVLFPTRSWTLTLFQINIWNSLIPVFRPRL